MREVHQAEEGEEDVAGLLQGGLRRGEGLQGQLHPGGRLQGQDHDVLDRDGDQPREGDGGLQELPRGADFVQRVHAEQDVGGDPEVRAGDLLERRLRCLDPVRGQARVEVPDLAKTPVGPPERRDEVPHLRVHHHLDHLQGHVVQLLDLVRGPVELHGPVPVQGQVRGLRPVQPVLDLQLRRRRRDLMRGDPVLHVGLPAVRGQDHDGLGRHHQLHHLRLPGAEREHHRGAADVAAHAVGLRPALVDVPLPGDPPGPPPPDVVADDVAPVGLRREHVDHLDVVEVLVLGRLQVDVVPPDLDAGDDGLHGPHRHRVLARGPLPDLQDPPERVLDSRREPHRDPERGDDPLREAVHARDPPLPEQRREHLVGHQGRVHLEQPVPPEVHAPGRVLTPGPLLVPQVVEVLPLGLLLVVLVEDQRVAHLVPVPVPRSRSTSRV